jgi:hypothetical protein
VTLTFKLELWATHMLAFLFFTGITGCAAVVIFSWISILKDGLSRDE